MPDGTPTLRPHHLLCILTWSGRGYTPDFTAQFHKVADHVAGGGAVRIVAGPDDMCKTLCPHTTPDYHCTTRRVARRDDRALADISTLLGRPVAVGDTITLAPYLPALRAAFKNGTIRNACKNCEFHDFCTDVANADFASTRLMGCA